MRGAVNPTATWALLLLASLIVARPWRRRLLRLVGIGVNAVTADADSVLVIGGTGLMGAPTAKLLASSGRRVVIMSRGHTKGMGTAGQRPDPPKGCTMLICDREDSAAFVKALSSTSCPRIVVDFTAMERRHVEDVLAAHETRPIQHYVFVSTNMVYPGGVERMDLSDFDGQVKESDVRRDLADEAPNNYGGNKLKCEALLEEAATRPSNPLPSSVVRPPAVVGPGCDQRHERLHRLVGGLEPLPPPERSRGPAAVPNKPFRIAWPGDVACVIEKLVGRVPLQPAEAFNVASGGADGITMDRYAGALAAAVQPPAKLVDRPSPVSLTFPVPDDPSLRNYERQGVLDTRRAMQLLVRHTETTAAARRARACTHRLPSSRMDPPPHVRRASVRRSSPRCCDRPPRGTRRCSRRCSGTSRARASRRRSDESSDQGEAGLRS